MICQKNFGFTGTQITRKANVSYEYTYKKEPIYSDRGCLYFLWLLCVGIEP
jgi:hypothetical protein